MLTVVNDAFLREINLSRWYFTVNLPLILMTRKTRDYS